MLRRRLLKPDSRGYFRPYVGYEMDAATERKRQPRFNLGKDEEQANFRYALIQKLYQENCAVIESDCWSPLALSYAKLLQRGTTKITVAPNDSLIEGYSDQPDVLALEYVQLLRVQQDWFPSLNLIPSDPVLYYQGMVLNQQIEQISINSLYDQLKNDGVVRAKKEPPARLIVGTLYECLDDYIRHIELTGNRLDDGTLKQGEQKRIDCTERNREVFPDCPLHDLQYERIDELVGLWRNRPIMQHGRRAKRITVKHHIDEFYRFMRWLDASSKYDWMMPRGIERISRKPVQLSEDRQISLLNKTVYSPTQLAVIYKKANDFDRFLLLVSLNCAFGAAEIGRLTEEEVLFNHEHQYADRLDFTTSVQDSFIRLMRPKTGVFGEWLLWPETADVLRWAIKRENEEGGVFIACRAGGSPLYNESSRNPQAAIAKRWNDLIDRVKKEDDKFPALPFGTLRDTIPDRLRHMGHDTLASMSVAHGTPFKGDSLLDCYGNRPYGRLHDALRKLRDFFSPLFA